ncbi:unnamed protein product [Albugo candida]|uniref:Uncharacterized protein n=1 Tax=Albugo candida TaxID=65357 RepID=A0A024GSS2_9STRA|nr:unnamed protein product [Albugo candida]|eukprot:CCI49781.1 unnamed protein product [Albugo candida]
MGQRSPHCLLLPVKTFQPNQKPKNQTASSVKSQPVKSKKTPKQDKINVKLPMVSKQCATNKHSNLQDASANNADDENISEYQTREIPSAVLDVDENKKNSKEQSACKSTEDTWTPVRARNKRNRSIARFQSLLSNALPKSLEGRIWKRYQIVSSKFVVKNDLANSKEAAHFIKKNHTRIEKNDHPTRVAEVMDFLIQGVRTAQSPPRPETLLKENVHVAKASRRVEFTSNGDSILKFALDHPIALNGVLDRCMRSIDPCLDQVVRIHTQPPNQTRIPRSANNGRIKSVGPFGCSKNYARNVEEWTRATNSLASFELMLMCTVPTIHHSDDWIQFVTDQTVVWIPAHHCRLLHTNVLLHIFRLPLGRRLSKNRRWIPFSTTLREAQRTLFREQRRPFFPLIFVTVTTWRLFSFTRLPTNIIFLSVIRIVFTLIPFGKE